MTLQLASALLNRAANGADLLRILEGISNDFSAGTVTDTDGTPIIWLQSGNCPHSPFGGSGCL